MNTPLSWFTTRRSIRRYQPDPVPQLLIEQLLTAASWAPSAHNRQPWRFAVISHVPTKQQLATAMGQKLRADLLADGVAVDVIERDVTRSYERITTASLLILLCLTMADMDCYNDPTRQQYEWVMAVQSTAMAGQNLLLAAHSLGLGACWMCAPLFSAEIVRQIVHLPADWQPQAFITVGYPAETRHKNREPLNGRILYFE